MARLTYVAALVLAASLLVNCTSPPDEETGKKGTTGKSSPSTPSGDEPLVMMESSVPPTSPVVSLTSDSSAVTSSAVTSEAGVCSRCHVVSVLEWDVSGHVDAGTDCQECHGPSAGHVADERNRVKPDRLPREAAIATLCAGCHEDGCPETLEAANCQKCHHVHALVDPTKTELSEEESLNALFELWESFRGKMRRGEELLENQDWTAARVAFLGALELVPSNLSARQRIEYCERRMDPGVPGFSHSGWS